MARPQYRFTRYSPEFMGDIIELHRHLWGPDAKLREAYINWKYVHNPYTRAPLIYLALDGEQVIGIGSFVGAKWECASQRISFLSPLEADVIIAPDHRNRGLVSSIMNAALKDLAQTDCPYVLSLGTIPKVLMSNMRRGWKSLGSLRPVTCITPQADRASFQSRVRKRMLSFYRKFHGGAGEAQSHRFHMFDRFHDQEGGKFSDHISMGKSPRISEMIRLRKRLDTDCRIRHVRDEEFYRWRLQNPRSHYRFLFWDDSDLQGYVILQATAFASAEPIGVIDWGAISPAALTDLLQAAVQLMCGETLFTWSATLAQCDGEVFEAAGFRPLPHMSTSNPWIAALRAVREGMLGHEWRLGEQNLLDIASWDFRMLDPRSF